MQFEARLEWQRNGQSFLDQKYSRGHEWIFDGGLRVPASSSPLSVPLPMSVADNVDPEEALVAAAASCHMLFFLSIAAQRGHTVESYVDNAVGLLEKDDKGRMAMTNITLRPEIVFAGVAWPSEEEIAAIHHEAHDKCYIANSLKTEITIEPAIEPEG
ncbi:organic hydroperoxide reductase OsmC/OhrA [Pseudoduganella flava]|uniref:Organic hydroperoxide reductase OsmC/OhrA n=1 Tax=Pseudoduganella flava TaxID=871742 RepID=A0A562PLK0_9BURK|nr:OsmC family protein [Pseudoduganella flava]QGZ40963.1 OsmC family peroxiredoxin [Pseudoduganella flava]TWI45351.1 organic hydroperoxide reductase OsmC/OhrA [Pseudoduganella flava]